jgi:hypothetical protein
LTDNFNRVFDLGWARSDARFTEGLLGEMYISSKWDGRVYIVTNSIPYDADFNDDQNVDGRDLLVWQRNLNMVGYGAAGDANHDGFVNNKDLAIWKEQYGTQPPPPSDSTAIPEPASLTLVLLGGVLMLGRPLQLKSCCLVSMSYARAISP